MRFCSIFISLFILLILYSSLSDASRALHKRVSPTPISSNPLPSSSSPVIMATLSSSVNNNSSSSSMVNSTQQDNPFAGKPTSASFANNMPPAYLTWKTPIPNQTFPPLYKIGVSNITLAWTADPNALKVQPMNLTIALANPQKQTITATIVQGTATEAYWDLATVDTPLMVGYYTVLVYDQRGPKAFPSPGWLMPDSRLLVALYSTEAYVGRSDSMFCPSCYVGSGESMISSMIPLITAFGVAMLTSIFILVSLLQ
ncbi:uncharacterized protein BX664DRAFT_365625 [Halteromyces radiatus]|uniref:uncharacterized protein n=1 Tax=Halteromyces radiatus TaxID=101107 RepID=UPI002220AC26|nr:uncharacterized protein BX664DRAFT_365625 [Halteromyces radiatus]KAI8089783.1 hypothetical protein BX664DRAFT_365625 [Halteromyces radiatus]